VRFCVSTFHSDSNLNGELENRALVPLGIGHGRIWEKKKGINLALTTSKSDMAAGSRKSATKKGGVDGNFSVWARKMSREIAYGSRTDT